MDDYDYIPPIQVDTVDAWYAVGGFEDETVTDEW
jgi:hypothetical protein